MPVNVVDANVDNVAVVILPGLLVNVEGGIDDHVTFGLLSVPEQEVPVADVAIKFTGLPGQIGLGEAEIVKGNGTTETSSI